MSHACLLTVAEVAALLRVSEETVAVWARSGRLPSIKLGRKTRRFDAATIAAFVAKGTAPGQPTPPAAGAPQPEVTP